MKNYLVIGNPIKHSISPKIHNYWFEKNEIQAKYNKEELLENQLEGFIKKIRNRDLDGANITVPYKEKIIPLIDELSEEAREANSVNTIYLSNKKVIGHNTDIAGFYLSLKTDNINFKNKKALILGSGGVTPSIIIALKRLGLENIVVSNRTKEKAINLKKRFKFLEVLKWGETTKANIIINATSLGLNDSDKIEIDFNIFEPDSFVYDVIYNPTETNFLKEANKKGLITQNGLMMFIFQAAEAFKTWHNVKPIIDNDLIDYLKND